MKRSRHVFVTPYLHEERALIERCIASVRALDGGADHILVADGYPQGWIDDTGVRHIKLDATCGDCGNTPRGVGALLAINAGYDAIGWLDVDCWLDPDHLARCLEAAAGVTDCDYVIARRRWRRLDGTVLPAPDELFGVHVDTNCFFLLAGGFHVMAHFATMPTPMARANDRIFYAALQRAGLVPATVATTTVNYHCRWASVYLRAGEVPPPGTRADIDFGELARWLRGLSPRERLIAGRRAGVVFEPDGA